LNFPIRSSRLIPNCFRYFSLHTGDADRAGPLANVLEDEFSGG
jgi:hypothetical protein